MNLENLGSTEILAFLPHRYPFLMVDRILSVTYPQGSEKDQSLKLEAESLVGSSVRGVKNVSVNEPQFLGHFPSNPIFPGVLTLETMAQVSSFVVYPFTDRTRSKAIGCVLVGVDSVRYRKPVFPGDALEIRSKLTRFRSTHQNQVLMLGFDCEAFVGDQRVAEASLLTQITTTG